MLINAPCVHCRQPLRLEVPHVGYRLSCPHCGGGLVVNPPAAPPKPTGDANPFLAALGIAAASFLVFKGVQHATDSWQGAGEDSLEYRGGFKRRLKAEHVANNGLTCPRCDRRVRSYAQLHVDHM